ncbi:MAG: hypothetical protein K6F92_08140 [Lachnospiraceae bacterium]|nr:hypothetical protein [Lachnospiraceae bacterium]
MKNVRINLKQLIIITLILISALSLCSCSSFGIPGRTTSEILVDLVEYLDGKTTGTVVLVSGAELDEVDEKALTRNISIVYTVGDIQYSQAYTMKYTYNMAFGWKLDTVTAYDENTWTTIVAYQIDIDRLVSDLEGEYYLSTYSNHTIESRRILEKELLNCEVNPHVGYDRITARLILDADNVHEVLSVKAEYLLDENGFWTLHASDIDMTDVYVQKGPTSDDIAAAVNSLVIHRDEEDSTWRLAELKRVTYEIIEMGELDSENSSQDIVVSFRGEGEYMYISGTATLQFRFSSGWYLYNSGGNIDASACETGMLKDEWLIGEDVLIATIINEKKFNYNNTYYAITTDNIANVEVTSRKITELGEYQTVYFKYDAVFANASFVVEGYAKYRLEGDVFTLEKWSDMPTITYDVTGTYYGLDFNDKYCAFYTLDIVDDQSGLLNGTIYVYGYDLRGDTPVNIFASGEITGNISDYDLSYELISIKWEYNNYYYYQDEMMPTGSYDFISDSLTFTNSVREGIKLSKELPAVWYTYSEFMYNYTHGNFYNMINTMYEKL